MPAADPVGKPGSRRVPPLRYGRPMLLPLILLACTAEPSPAPSDSGANPGTTPTGTIKERCFPDIGDESLGFPAYDELGAVVPDHCSGTDHQDITDIERLVFLGDSVTAGTPPTDEDRYYRVELTEDLQERWPGLEVSDCSEWGDRTDDLLAHKDRGLNLCFPEGGDDRRTLIVMTVGGNDMLEAAETVAAKGEEAAKAEIDQAIAYLDEAFAWVKEGADLDGASPERSDRFPGGVFVVFGNVYEFTDATGDLDSCPMASYLGFSGTIPQLRDGYIYVNEAFMALAVKYDLDAVLMLENFCGHGFHAGDPENECYRGDDAEVWFDNTCIHPNETGHAEMQRMFRETIEQ